MLDAEGKPVYVNVANSFVASATTFSQWYRDTPGVNHTTAGTLTLWSNGQGQYVNRYGPNGEQWIVTAQAYYCGNVGREMLDAAGNPIPCTSLDAATTNCTEMDALGLHATVVHHRRAGTTRPPTRWPRSTGRRSSFRSTRTRSRPSTPPSGSARKRRRLTRTGWPRRGCRSTTSTSRARSATGSSTTGPTVLLDFTGDDDVWVFINRKLAVDLGGIHTPVQGSVTFGMGQAAATRSSA